MDIYRFCPCALYPSPPSCLSFWPIYAYVRISHSSDTWALRIPSSMEATTPAPFSNRRHPVVSFTPDPDCIFTKWRAYSCAGAGDCRGRSDQSSIPLRPSPRLARGCHAMSFTLYCTVWQEWRRPPPWNRVSPPACPGHTLDRIIGLRG